jgi:hypothetical protein
MEKSNQRNTPADALSVAKGAGAWPDRMPDVNDSQTSMGVNYTMSEGGIGDYCKSDDMMASKPNDAFNRADMVDNTNDMAIQNMVYEVDIPNRTPGK